MDLNAQNGDCVLRIQLYIYKLILIRLPGCYSVDDNNSNQEVEICRMNRDELDRCLNPETFREEAFSRLKAEYPWVTKEDLNPNYHFDIENVDGKYKYIQYEIQEDGTRKEIYSETYDLEEKDGIFELVFRYFSFIDHKENCSFFNANDIYRSIYEKYKRYVLMSDRAKFPYGYDINIYVERAFRKLKTMFPWVTKDDLNPEYRYNIEMIDDKYEYVEYCVQKDGSEKYYIMSEREGMSPDSFVRTFIFRNKEYLLEHDEVISECSILPPESTDPGGWHIERYVIQKRKRGDYTLFVQSGDRNSGSFSVTLIPRTCFEADNFDEFLARYAEALPSFGVDTDFLYRNSDFRSFLGYA